MAKGAIITADIVNSTLLSVGQEKKLKTEISSLLASGKFEFFRGDSFQAWIKNPEQALTLVLRIRTMARKISLLHDVRASIGIGEVGTGTKNLSTATDEAFVYSGRTFDTLAQSDRRLIIRSKNDIANHGFQVICYFVDYLFKTLTEKQAEVFFVLLAEKTQREAAKKLRKSQSTINKHVQSGGWHALSLVLDEYQALAAKL